MKYCSLTTLVLGVFLCQTARIGLAAEQQQSVVLHDPSNSVLRSSHQKASAEAATATLCAASGLVPPIVVDQSTAADVEAVVQAQSVLGQAPKAVLMLHLAGVSPGRLHDFLRPC